MSVFARHVKAHQRSPRAFTLIEVLVSLAVFSIIITTIGSVFFYLYRDWKKQKDYMKVLQDSYWAVEALSAEIRQATEIVADTDPVSWRLETNYLPSKLCVLIVWPPVTIQHVWIWRGTRAGISNENDTYGYDGYLYRGYGCAKDALTEWNHGAWQYRNILCRFITGYTNVYNAAAGLVYVNLTLRPQPDVPDGILNRNLTVNTIIRRRN
jgi:prepilin-type N-terminal cleavage/methylation domain-containing protein